MLTIIARESDRPFEVAADSNDDEFSPRPLIEIITTVSEAAKHHYGHLDHGITPPPGNFDDDNGFGNVKVKEVESTEMIVHSKYLINAFNAVIGSYPGTNFLEETVSIEAPYHALIQHRDSLSRYKIAQPACHDDEYAITTAKHIDVLLSLLDKTYGEKIRDEEARYKRNPPAATFELLWLLFKPGEVVYMECHNAWAPFVITRVDTERDIDGKLLWYRVSCWDIRFLRGRMRRCMYAFIIGAFSGEQVISTLELVPAAFFPEDLQKQDGLLMCEKQIAIGKTYWELVKRPAYKEYDGKTIDRDSTRTAHVSRIAQVLSCLQRLVHTDLFLSRPQDVSLLTPKAMSASVISLPMRQTITRRDIPTCHHPLWPTLYLPNLAASLPNLTRVATA